MKKLNLKYKMKSYIARKISGAVAVIVGGITIGKIARIGANTMVTFDVPENSTVVSQTARVIAHDNERENLFTQY